MQFITFLSNIIIPLVVFSIIGYGLLSKCRVFDCFARGANDGFSTALDILPTLIGLMVAVGILRASGLLDALSFCLETLFDKIGFPAELIPLSIVKMFSSSASTGLLIDIYKNYGTDSIIGNTASIMLSSTETIFYTMSVYLMHSKVTKSRYILPGALFSTLAGTAASVFLGRLIS